MRPAHQLGVDPIADELLGRFGDQPSGTPNSGGDTARSARSAEGSDSHSRSSHHAVDLEPSDMAVDFRQRLDKIMQSSNAGSAAGAAGTSKASPKGAHSGETAHAHSTSGGVPGKVYTRPLQKQKVVGGMLDKDLKAYFMIEDHTRRLSNMGFYEKDDFMNFD